MVLYILFLWSGTLSALNYCSACTSLSEGDISLSHISDISLKRDVLHVHLLLCHLVLPWSYCFLQTVKKIPMYFVNKLK